MRTKVTECITSSGLEPKRMGFALLQIVISNCSQDNHEELCKFHSRVSEYFYDEYRKICYYKVIGQIVVILKNFKGSFM